MHCLIVCCTCAGGDFADNGLDQLTIEGEAMSVVKALIQQGQSLEVQEGAMRLLARLCSVPEARQQASTLILQ